MVDYVNQRAQTVLILCKSPKRCVDLEIIAKASGGTILEAECFLDTTPVERWPAVDYLLVELFSNSDEAETALRKLSLYLKNNASHLLLWTDLELLETAYAMMPSDRSHFLIDASDVEAMPILKGINRQMSLDQFHDKSRDDEYQSLHRISDELADFARTLARIAEQDGEMPTAVRDKPVGYRAAPAGLFAPLSPEPVGKNGPDAASIRNLIRMRRLREQHFAADLFADPAWDILLDLFAARLEGKQVSVSSLCIAASVPPTTALRWITTMTENGTLLRKQDPQDARRVFIELSPDSENRLNAYFSDIRARGGLPI